MRHSGRLVRLSEFKKLCRRARGDSALICGWNALLHSKTDLSSQEWTSIDRIVIYRWDLAQKAGITKEPENWEEFQEMILAIIREDPEAKGIQGMTVGNTGILTGLLLPYASSIAAGNGNDFYWKKDSDGVYKPVYFVDDMTCAFQLGRDMYTSGVIEKTVIQQTTNSAREKFLQERMRRFFIPEV